MMLISRFVAGVLASLSVLTGALISGWTPIRDSSIYGQVGRNDPPGRLLYVRDGNIWLWQAGGTKQITSGDTWRQPAWSPDGLTIAYVQRGQNFSDIFIMKDDGGENRRLTTGQARLLDNNDWVFRPTWTPDGTQVAFVADIGTSFLQPWTMNTEGGAKRQLQIGSGFEMVDSVAWAPDGKRLAIAGFRRNSTNGLPQAGQIYIWEANKTLQSFTENQNGAFDPSWSPNGEWIAYAGRNGARSNVFARPVGEGEEVQVSKLDLARSPAWSPDGRSIAFLSAQNLKGTFSVMVVDVSISDGHMTVSNERTLIADAAVDATSGLSWGP
jgi:TolB protein